MNPERLLRPPASATPSASATATGAAATGYASAAESAATANAGRRHLWRGPKLLGSLIPLLWSLKSLRRLVPLLRCLISLLWCLIPLLRRLISLLGCLIPLLRRLVPPSLIALLRLTLGAWLK